MNDISSSGRNQNQRFTTEKRKREQTFWRSMNEKEKFVHRPVENDFSLKLFVLIKVKICLITIDKSMNSSVSDKSICCLRKDTRDEQLSKGISLEMTPFKGNDESSDISPLDEGHHQSTTHIIGVSASLSKVSISFGGSLMSSDDHRTRHCRKSLKIKQMSSKVKMKSSVFVEMLRFRIFENEHCSKDSTFSRLDAFRECPRKLN